MGRHGSNHQAPTPAVWSYSDCQWSGLRGEWVTVIDYRTYYHLEHYVFHEISAQYRKAGQLAAFDFFCIVIWKANRSKSKIAHRFLAKGFHDLESAVAALTRALATAPDDKERMRILIDEWGFQLPMASAILTVLCPELFTMYDMRVCDVLGDFQKTPYRANMEARQTASPHALCGSRPPPWPPGGIVFGDLKAPDLPLRFPIGNRLGMSSPRPLSRPALTSAAQRDSARQRPTSIEFPHCETCALACTATFVPGALHPRCDLPAGLIGHRVDGAGGHAPAQRRWSPQTPEDASSGITGAPL
jgi:hypothetical protein